MIKERRSQRPEARAAARSAAVKEGKEKKVNFDFEPFKPISASLGRRNLDCSSEVSHSSWEVLAVLS